MVRIYSVANLRFSWTLWVNWYRPNMYISCCWLILPLQGAICGDPFSPYSSYNGRLLASCGSLLATQYIEYKNEISGQLQPKLKNARSTKFQQKWQAKTLTMVTLPIQVVQSSARSNLSIIPLNLRAFLLHKVTEDCINTNLGVISIEYRGTFHQINLIGIASNTTWNFHQRDFHFEGSVRKFNQGINF